MDGWAGGMDGWTDDGMTDKENVGSSVSVIPSAHPPLAPLPAWSAQRPRLASRRVAMDAMQCASSGPPRTHTHTHAHTDWHPGFEVQSTQTGPGQAQPAPGQRCFSIPGLYSYNRWPVAAQPPQPNRACAVYPYFSCHTPDDKGWSPMRENGSSGRRRRLVHLLAGCFLSAAAQHTQHAQVWGPRSSKHPCIAIPYWPVRVRRPKHTEAGKPRQVQGRWTASP